ncbi:NUDIX hydrolase domain-like protein [Poronia punctata]|nr:NUDIX hydrolase domain-like protein [Poronia punctata]
MASDPSLADTTAEGVALTAPGAPTVFSSGPSVAHLRVPLKTYLETSKLHGAIVGTYVFDKAGRVLLVQRAAHDSMPHRWEIPGGGVDREDESILHAALRELWEEAGLRAHSIKGLVGPGYHFLSPRGSPYCKFSFIVEVEDYNVKLDPNEHQAFLWVTEEEAAIKKCGDVEFSYTTRNQEASMREAFKIYKQVNGAQI